MKLILLVIFIIIYFNAILSKTLKINDIYKRSNSDRYYQRPSTKFLCQQGPPTFRKSNSHSRRKQKNQNVK